MIDESYSKEFGVLIASMWLAVAILRYLTMRLMKQGERKMSEEKIGIKETKEALEGLNQLALLIIGQAKDGIQVGDAVAIVEKLLLDPEFKAKLIDAVNGVSHVPAELKDLDVQEIFELGKFEAEKIQAIIKALK